jgi:hypothetical protein
MARLTAYWPARRLLLAASAVTLAMNIADPVCAGQWGKAAFDSVGPLLLMGWAEVGPGLLRAVQAAVVESGRVCDLGSAIQPSERRGRGATRGEIYPTQRVSAEVAPPGVDPEKLERARTLGMEHWRAHRRPISAETLRRELVAVVRAETRMIRSDAATAG